MKVSETVFGTLWASDPTQPRLATSWKQVLRSGGRPPG